MRVCVCVCGCVFGVTLRHLKFRFPFGAFLLFFLVFLFFCFFVFFCLLFWSEWKLKMGIFEG